MTAVVQDQVQAAVQPEKSSSRPFSAFERMVAWRYLRSRRKEAFVSVIADYDRKRLLEVVEGKTAAGLEVALSHIPGRENARYVICDLADPFKNFARSFFPNAVVIADKFHVLRLLSPAINRRRKAITGDKRSLAVRRPCTPGPIAPESRSTR